MSVIVRQPEALRQEIIQMQREAAEAFAKKGLKKFAVAGSTPPPNGPSNFNDISKFKKYLELYRLMNEKIDSIK